MSRPTFSTRSLRLLHPFVPFVTERIIHQDMNDEIDGRPTRSCSVPGRNPTDGTYNELEESLKQIQEVVTAVRSIRSELNVSSGKKSDLYIRVEGSVFRESSCKTISSISARWPGGESALRHAGQETAAVGVGGDHPAPKFSSRWTD